MPEAETRVAYPRRVRKYIESLEHEVLYLDKMIENRAIGGKACDREKMRRSALLWALAVVEKHLRETRGAA